MKNTKHTENLDNSTPQEITSQSKRKILTSIGVSSGIIGASALSQQWTKPIVNSIILPAHAQTTDMMGGDDDGDGMGDGTTTTTTPEMDAMGPMINVVGYPTSGMVGDGAMATYHVSLSQAPAMNPNTGAPGTVTVMATSEPDLNVAYSGGDEGDVPTALTFTSANYGMAQTLTVATEEGVPTDPSVTVTFEAMGGGYDDVEATAMFTIVNDDSAPPMKVTATRGATLDTRFDVTIKWETPDTNKDPVGYEVSSDQSMPEMVTLGASARMHTFKGVPAENHVFTVTAHYKADGSDSESATAALDLSPS